MIKFRKFLNKSQVSTPKKAEETTINRDCSPKIGQDSEEAQQIEVVLVQKESTNTGDSNKSEVTSSSFICQNQLALAVKNQ